MPEDLSQAIAIDEPFPGEAPAAEAPPEDDELPEGVQVVNGQPVITPSILAAERKRAREKAKEDAEREFAPLRQKAAEADALRQALEAARPFIEEAQRRVQPPAPQEPTVSDEEAANYARRYELFEATSGQPDVKRAKVIIADNRREAAEIARRAAQEAVAPIQASSAEQASRQNFAYMCSLRDETGQPLIDPKVLAEEWVTMGADLTQHPQVAEVVLERALGKMVRQGKRGRASVPPQFSESVGGRPPAPIGLSDTGRKMGLTADDVKAAAKTFKPGDVSPIGDW